jgi:hypothetical protein
MKRRHALSLILLVFPYSITFAELLDYRDGLTHNITTYLPGPLARIDFESFGLSTTVNILPTASVYKFEVFNEGHFNLLGGTVRDELWGKDSSHISIDSGYVKHNVFAHDNSILNISGGSVKSDIVVNDNAQGIFSNCSVNRISTYQNSQFTIESGLVTKSCLAYGDSLINIHGGIFNGIFQAIENGTFAFYGSDFLIDGKPLYPGRYFASDFTQGQLTGILENGNALNAGLTFYGDTSSIVIIPEPATLSLLALGAIFMKRRNYR